MKNKTVQWLTGSAAGVAICGAIFTGANAWWVSTPALAEHEARDDMAYTAMSATLAALHKEMKSAEKQRRGKAVRNTEDSIMLLKGMGTAVPPQQLERVQQRLRREIRDFEAMDK